VANNKERRRNEGEIGIRGVFQAIGETQGVWKHFRGRRIGWGGKTFPKSSRGRRVVRAHRRVVNAGDRVLSSLIEPWSRAGNQYHAHV